MNKPLLLTAAMALLCTGLHATDNPLTPRLVGDWWTVAGDPDLGTLTNPNQQPVDFGIWRAADGSWQIWSCIRGTKGPGKTRLFHRWEGAKLTDTNWTPKGIALHADPALGETQGGLQAPYVLRHQGKYWMFYGDWANICLAASTDGKTFTRYRNQEGRPQLDFAGRFDTGRNTRDPMVRRIGNKWYCYYTAHPANKGCDYARTSDDLLHWSEEHVVAAGGRSGDGPYSAECPFVVEPQPGHLYLFRTQRYGKDAQTMVYHSQDALDFGIDNDAEHYVTTLPVAAPEIFQHEGKWYMAALLPSLKGIQITRMEWVPKNETSIINLLGSDFQGGANKTYGMAFHDRTNVNYVYAAPTAALATMRASFELKSEPAEEMHLLLDARQNEGPLSCTIEISVNDTILLSGPNAFPKVWHVRSFAIPKGVLKSGSNTLTIRNLEPAGAAGSPPWFMVSRCAIGPAAFALPRILNFRKYSVSLPAEVRPIPEPLQPGKKPGFAIRGIKGWNWTAEQYLEEIPVLAEYRMNFLMNCYLSNFETEGKWINKWWEPLSEKRRQDYIKIIRECERYHINFCFAVHPQLASPRPLDPNKAEDVEAYFRHYAWAQEQGVKWFSISLDDVSWGEQGPGAGGAAHARLVNTIFDRLRRKDKDAQMIFCPVPYWGDGTRKEDREYLEALARDLHPDVYVFWTGNQVAPARMRAKAARSYKGIVKHRLIIWENYPVNDASPTMHLGPITGRDPALASIADGYMSNPLCPQNQINRIPLLTCADFAWNSAGYDPARSIGQAVLHWGKTDDQRQVLKELVELYPGAILAKPSKAGYLPVYSAVLAQFQDKLESSAEEAQAFVRYVEEVEQRLLRAFPDRFADARKTLQQNIAEMKDIQKSSAANGLLLAAVASPHIPALRWEKGSDWINVKTGITPAAIGDGQADDTVALQKALAGVRDGTVLYFPPGTYRITAPLSLKNPTAARWIGGLIVGSGRDTKLVWDGVEGGTMLLLNGMAYSRFVGFELDGHGKASVGFHYRATQGFQTEVTHRHLAFRGFTNAAVLEDHPNEGQALAETTFENCLFEDCERGVAFLQFNDYDFTFDGCEFRGCGVAIDCNHGNFYVRNCHFEGSRVVDIRDGSEHCSSIRRSTSTGSRAFVLRSSSVAPLTVQDCRVDGWKNPEGAVLLSRPPLLLFDCDFTRPPKDADGIGVPPVRVHSDGQRLLVSGNQVHGASGLTQGAHPMLMSIPAGERKGVINSADRSFLRDTVRLPMREFDARRDFGAQANGLADDTAAIQKTIDAAAAASGGAIAYLPSGRYVVTNTLRITGKDFFVGGSGWSTQLIWHGIEGGVMVELRDAQDVVVEDLMVGAHDAGSMNNGVDIHQAGSTRGSRVTYDGVYVFGMYQKQPQRKGFLFTDLGENDVVIMPHVQGNLRFVDCGRATVLANCSYEGSVVVEGKDKARGGFLGFQTRLATIVTHGLYLRNNHSIVMSDFYVEQADNGYLFEGASDDPPGCATLTGAKFHSFTSSDPAKNTLVDIRNYRGQISIGPYQFYQEPKRMRMKQQGAEPADLLVWASSWYGAKPDPQLGPAARLWPVGNEFYGTAPNGEPAIERMFFQEMPTDSSLAKLSRALDDLRRLGEIDLRFNHPSISK